MFVAGNKESLIKIANMSFFAVYLSIIAIITHAHRHNLNMHPRDRLKPQQARAVKTLCNCVNTYVLSK